MAQSGSKKTGFDHQHDAVEAALARNPPDVPDVQAALGDLHKIGIPPEMDLAQLQRHFTVCYRALDYAQTVDLIQGGGVLRYYAQTLIERVFLDTKANRRPYALSDVRRTTAFQTSDGAYANAPAPYQHMALTRAQAADLAAPYFRFLETELETTPTAHFKFCWSVREFPLMPFAHVMDDWLADLDRRAAFGGRHVEALDRAFSLATLAEEGQQKLSWEKCLTNIIPQLNDPHPLIASAAARYLGVIYSDPDDFFTDAPSHEPLLAILDRIRTLPTNRRPVAGGFLDGYSHLTDPFFLLAKDLPDFDRDAWVLDVLDQGEAENYIPSAQAFWFYVHEAYWNRPDFALTLIKRGDPWVALMCATEAPQDCPEMAVVLRRLSAHSDPQISENAAAALARLEPLH